MKRYSIAKIDGKMVVTPDKRGGYRASTLYEIKRALSELDFRTTTAEVLIGKRWSPLGRRHIVQRKPRRHINRYSVPQPIKPLPKYLRILRRLHLYKDPLDILFYKGGSQ